MNASHVSASSDTEQTKTEKAHLLDESAGAREAILICGVNWVGDTIMTLPALQAFREAHHTAYITLLVKPNLFQLCRLHEAVNEVLPLKEGLLGTLRTAHMIRKRRFDKAYILPHSFRSALIPFLAGVPKRIGMPGHWRGAMMTDIVKPKGGPDREHQAWEYIDLFDLNVKTLPEPHLHIPEDAQAMIKKKLKTLTTPRVGLIPGAARGPSKRWPESHFIETGKKLMKKGCGIVTLGISREAPLCERVAKGIGPDTLNLAGQTTLAEWAAILKTCDLILANDSGGMHLAAAVGTPVVALFGITDPRKTGPIGRNCNVIQNSEIQDRDIDRDSPEAIKSLASITPEQVYEAAIELLEQKKKDT